MAFDTKRISWRRVAVVGGATVLTVLGLVGLVLPVLPGVVFLLGALALLTREFAWASRVLDAIRPGRTTPQNDQRFDD